MQSGSESDRSLIGVTVGNYRVVSKLGEGGMGAVYLAEHPLIGKKVALKVLHDEFTANEEVVSRFFTEAKSVNDIQHPNIVDIVDFGRLERPGQAPRVYFLMEYLDGQSLADIISKEAPLEPRRALDICVQVAEALAASHAHGIVHRDLKPDNIVLVKRQGGLMVKVLDFGIAKLTGDDRTSKRTRTGMVMGTPAYMSPEQCEGRGEVDHRTDVYSLGVMLFEMLTGRVPFSGQGYGEILVQHLTQPPPRPSSLTPSIPEALEAVILKALEKRPGNRFESMTAMLPALRDPGSARLRLTGQAYAVDPEAVAHAVRSVPGEVTTLGSSSAELAAVDVLPRSSWARNFGIVAGLAAVALGAWIAVGRGGASGDGSPRSASADPGPAAIAPIPSRNAVTPVAAPAPAQVSLSLHSNPPGAAVWFAGETVPRGVTPLTVQVDQGTTPIEVSFVLAGFAKNTRQMSRSSNAELEVALVASPKASGSDAAASVPPKKPEAPKPPANAKRPPRPNRAPAQERSPTSKPTRKSCSDDPNQPGCGDNLVAPSF